MKLENVYLGDPHLSETRCLLALSLFLILPNPIQMVFHPQFPLPFAPPSGFSRQAGSLCLLTSTHGPNRLL